jgi:hypothetical protein
MPVNKRLQATPLDAANGQTVTVLKQWGELHAWRAAFGVAATGVMLWAVLR